MNTLQIIFILFTLLTTTITYSQENLPESASSWKFISRESESIFIPNNARLKKNKIALNDSIIKELSKKNVLEQLVQGELNSLDFIFQITNTSSYESAMDSCLQLQNMQNDHHRCREIVLTDFVIKLRALNYIDDLAGLILNSHIKQNLKQFQWLKSKNIDLKSYLTTLKQVEKNYLKNQTSIEPTLLAARNYRKRHSIWGLITPRQELYLSYNFMEIKLLSQILVKTQERILAQNAYIAWDFDGDGKIDEAFRTPDSWKYDMALSILDFTIQQETLSQGILANHVISKQHLMSAVSELGIANEEIIKTLVTLPDFKKPKSDKPELYLRALWAIGKTALLVVPGGVYFILPVIIIETVVENNLKKKKDKPRVF